MKCCLCDRAGVMIAILNGRPVCYYGCDHTSTAKMRVEETSDDKDYDGPPMMAFWSGGSE